MCLSCATAAFRFGSAASQPLSRREVMRHGAALGMALPFGAMALSGPAFAADEELPAEAFRSGMEALLERARSPELVGHRFFDIAGTDLPWTDLGLEARKGQQVTLLVTGRMWLARPHDLWFRPGLVLHARTAGRKPIFSPGTDTSTMTAVDDGPLEVARLLPLLADEDGRLTVPEEVYRAADARLTGIALLWRGEAAAGLADLAGHGDVAGLLAAEIARLQSGRSLPEGWSNLFLFGGGEQSFVRSPAGEIVCESAGSASIIERPLPMPLSAEPKLGWRWAFEQLPSAVPEDQAPFHDYLSIGVRFDDGQDLTYLWSAGLPVGKVFRCPLAGWNAVETHMVVASGTEGLGAWRAEERTVAADYAAHIGGSAKAITHVWLLAITPFQRKRGACRFADITVTAADGATHRL